MKRPSSPSPAPLSLPARGVGVWRAGCSGKAGGWSSPQLLGLRAAAEAASPPGQPDALTLTMDALGAGFSAGLRTDFYSVACRGYRLSISRARLPPPAGPGVRRVAVQVRGLTPFACGRCCFTLTGRVGAAPTPVCARQRERERHEGSGGHTKVGAGSLRAQEVSPPSGSREALPEALPNTSPRFVRGLLPSLPRGAGSVPPACSVRPGRAPAASWGRATREAPPRPRCPTRARSSVRLLCRGC